MQVTFQFLLHIQEIKVLVAGEINAGKSSLISSLIGENLLPSKITGHTAAIHYCKYGARSSCLVHFRPELNRSAESIPLVKSELGEIFKFSRKNNSVH